MASVTQLTELMRENNDLYQSEWEYREIHSRNKWGKTIDYQIVMAEDEAGGRGPGIIVTNENLAAYIVAMHNETLARLVIL